MIINNKHIQGIFKYSDGLEFERGDFVILNTVLYICLAEFPTNPDLQVVKGQRPDLHPENFNVYLGDKITSVEEYFEYLENSSENEDKYVSSHTLSGILNHYMFGLGERGIIKESVGYNSSTQTMTITEGLKEKLSSKSGGILNNILRAKDLNNVLVSISSSLPEIKNIFGKYSDTDIVILRQYTYESMASEEVSTVYRCQELVNPVLGIVYYRATEGFGFDSVSDWKSSFYDTNTKLNLDRLFGYYQELNNNLSKQIEDVKNRFCFAPININKANSIIIQCSDPEKEGYLEVPKGSFEIGNQEVIYNSNLKDRLVLDILIRRKVNYIWNNFSITIDLLDSLVNDGSLVTEYSVGVGMNIILRVRPIDNNNINLVLEPVDAIISNIYYRKYNE